MSYANIILYVGILVIALIVSLSTFKAVSSRNALIKAALYHYFMNHRETESETHVKGTSLPSAAYGLAIGKFQKMNDGQDEYNSCFEILNHQVQTFGGRNAMLQAVRRCHFPK